MKYTTTLVIESEQDPSEWSLQEYYWAVENDEARIMQEDIYPIEEVTK
jgi:hypothetical protein